MVHRQSFYDLTSEELKKILNSHHLSVTGADLLYKWHYKFKNTSPCEDNLAVKTQEFIKNHFHFNLPVIEHVQLSDDQTVKLLLKLEDQKTIECVLIPFKDKYTLCLSSQVGCAMKCSFCFTGEQGFSRHLSTHEIVTQLIVAFNWLKEFRPDGPSIKNIVFMGQGEPLHNFDAVKKACEIFLDRRGFGLGIQKITISTAGYLPGLIRWKDEIPGVNLALSLHAIDPDKRNKLIPINQKYPLEEIFETIAKIPLQRKQYFTYEYILIKDFNDTNEDAHLLGKRLQGTQSIINLIPFNPYPGNDFQKSTQAQVEEFKKIIEHYHLPALVRGTKGDDILAACGQLNTKLKNIHN